MPWFFFKKNVIWLEVVWLHKYSTIRVFWDQEAEHLLISTKQLKQQATLDIPKQYHVFEDYLYILNLSSIQE